MNDDIKEFLMKLIKWTCLPPDNRTQFLQIRMEILTDAAKILKRDFNLNSYVVGRNISFVSAKTNNELESIYCEAGLEPSDGWSE